MSLSFHESGNNPTQGEQRFVDVASFLGALIHSPRPAHIFTSSQIHQVEFSYTDNLLSFREHLTHRHRDDKHRVRSRRLLVQKRLCCATASVSSFQQRENVCSGFHVGLLQALHHHSRAIFEDANLGGIRSSAHCE